MDRSKMSASLSASIMSKAATFHLRFGKHATRARSFRTARTEVGKAVQDVVHIIRIMTFLHSAKDLPSVLRLYGIEDPRAYPNPNEM
jgi:hypothetical protein